jgi:preprotein translocase SecE subunit
MIERIKNFIQESRKEFKLVNWPSRAETIRYTLFVIGLALTLAVFLGFFDFIFFQILERSII